jgi:uncharacterized cofD-like protein
MNKKIVVIGGGTGTFTVLSGLKKYPVDLTAIVSMSDNGGSTGRLRDEYGVLPPGDIRQCLVALSDAPESMRNLFNYRFDGGALGGHSFGNIFLTALEKTTGNFNEALALASDILKVRGRVIPVTLDKAHLSMTLRSGHEIEGEAEINENTFVSEIGVKKIALTRRTHINPVAVEALESADLIVVGPGNLYGSIIPNFLVGGMSEAFSRSRGKKIYVCNLMNKYGHTDLFSPCDYLREVEKYIGESGSFDLLLYNTRMPRKSVLKRYHEEGTPVPVLEASGALSCEARGADLLSDLFPRRVKGDAIVRTLIRHDSDKLAKLLVSYL